MFHQKSFKNILPLGWWCQKKACNKMGGNYLHLNWLRSRISGGHQRGVEVEVLWIQFVVLKQNLGFFSSRVGLSGGSDMTWQSDFLFWWLPKKSVIPNKNPTSPIWFFCWRMSFWCFLRWLWSLPLWVSLWTVNSMEGRPGQAVKSLERMQTWWNFNVSKIFKSYG